MYNDNRFPAYFLCYDQVKRRILIRRIVHVGEARTEEDFDVMILSKNVGNCFLSLSDSALRKSTEKYISRLREYFFNI